MDGFPKDGFSVQWNSCLRLGTSGHFRFLLGSDDGSRLFVDGELLIDNWGEHDFRPSGVETDLRAGLHPLRVEFFDKRGAARIALWMGTGNEPSRPIPTDHLVLPETGPGDVPSCVSR
jgi:hypothetical protein